MAQGASRKAPAYADLLRTWALWRFACLREAASTEAGRASVKAADVKKLRRAGKASSKTGMPDWPMVCASKGTKEKIFTRGDSILANPLTSSSLLVKTV